MSQLIIPIPKNPKLVPAGYAKTVNGVLAEIGSLDYVKESKQQIAALRAYVTKKEHKNELQAAERWCEVRIGELLGEPKFAGPGRGKKHSPTSEGFPQKDDRHKFRILADHRPFVGTLIDKGTVTRNKILTEIRAREREREALPEVTQGVVSSLDELNGRKFGTIYADPPWAYGNQGTRAATGNHYDTLTIDELCAWKVGNHADEQSHLHLWTTNGFIREAFKLIDAWGFEYKSMFVWCKDKMGIGNYWRVSHEILLLGVRGNLTFADRSLWSYATLARTEHSKKPEKVREWIQSASPGPRLELFGRKAIQGWTVLGNQVGPMQRKAEVA